MLKGISPVISPILLKTLAEMGHGDEILFADAHYPAHTYAQRIIHADGLGIDALLDGTLPLFELDRYVSSPVIMMDAVPGDTLDPNVANKYRTVINRYAPNTPDFELVERFAFYERSQKCFAIVVTGSTEQYANLIIKKGVTPIQ